MLLVLIGFALAVRFYLLGEIPVGTYWDETAMLADARFVANLGRDINNNHWFQAIFFSYGDYKLPIYIWLASVSVRFFGNNPWALRLPSALTGLMTLGVVVLIAKQLFSKHVHESSRQKWLFCWLLPIAVSPWAIMFARTGFEGHLGQLFLAVSVWLVLKAAASRRFKLTLLLAAQLAAAIATYTYFSVRFVWPIVFLTQMVLANWPEAGLKAVKPLSSRHFLRQLLEIIKFAVFKLLLPLGLFLLLLAPMTNSPFYQDSNRFRFNTTSVLNMNNWALESNILREKTGNTVISRLFYHRYVLIGRELLRNFSDNLSLNYLFVNGDPNLRHGTGEHGLFLLPFLPILLLGLYRLWMEHKREFILLNVWWLAAVLPASVPDDTPHALRSLNALVPVSLILGFTVFSLVKQGFKQGQTAKKLAGAVWAGWLLFSTAQFTHFYFNVYPVQSAPEWQAGYRTMAEDACQAKDDYSQIWIDHGDDKFFLWVLAYCQFDRPLSELYQYKDDYRHQLLNLYFDHYQLSDLDPNGDGVLFITRSQDLNKQQTQPAAKIVKPIPKEIYHYFIGGKRP